MLTGVVDFKALAAHPENYLDARASENLVLAHILPFSLNQCTSDFEVSHTYRSSLFIY